MTCKHTDGWIPTEQFAISKDGSSLGFDEHTLQCKCNHLGCNETRKFKFDIVNVEEVKE